MDRPSDRKGGQKSLGGGNTFLGVDSNPKRGHHRSASVGTAQGLPVPALSERKKMTGSGHHFTWLLSTGRDYDLDVVEDDDRGDSAMAELDEEFVNEMGRRAALKDIEAEMTQEDEEDDMGDGDVVEEVEEEDEMDVEDLAMAQMDEEDRLAREEYSDGFNLVSPRVPHEVRQPIPEGETRLDLAKIEKKIKRPPPFHHRVLHHIPCTTCCYPIDGNYRYKECTPARVRKKTEKFCLPNWELLKTLRVVKHVRIFNKLLSGRAKQQEYEYEEDTSSNTQNNVSATAEDLQLQETELPPPHDDSTMVELDDLRISNNNSRSQSADSGILSIRSSTNEVDILAAQEEKRKENLRKYDRSHLDDEEDQVSGGDAPLDLGSNKSSKPSYGPKLGEVEMKLQGAGANNYSSSSDSKDATDSIMSNMKEQSDSNQIDSSGIVSDSEQYYRQGEEISPFFKPSWKQRKNAVWKRIKMLSRETLENVKPGVVTAFINFPLVLAVAGGVGAHPYLGLNAAFWSACAAMLFGGSRYTIAAPTMLLTANLVDIVQRQGFLVLPIIALWSALIIFLLIFTRAIELVTFVPSMTTHGVTLGTSILVIIYQIKFAIGLQGDIHASSVPYYIYQTCIMAFTQPNWWAILMFVISMILTWITIRFLNNFPVAFITVPCGIIASWLLDYFVHNQSLPNPYIETLGTRYGHVEFHPVLVNHWQMAFVNWEVLGQSWQIAFICILESYSTANLTYEITGKRFSKNHEMFALASANFISGLFGGMPTSVGVTRTLLNIRNGATSRAAGFVNGVCLLIFAATMTSWLRYMPLPVVAALQVTAAWRSVDTNVWTRVWKADKNEALTSLTTAFLCVFVNPFIGLLLGIVISMSIFSRALSKGHSELTVKTKVHRATRTIFLPASTSTINTSFIRNVSSRTQSISASPSSLLNIKSPLASPDSPTSPTTVNIPKMNLNQLKAQGVVSEGVASATSTGSNPPPKLGMISKRRKGQVNTGARTTGQLIGDEMELEEKNMDETELGEDGKPVTRKLTVLRRKREDGMGEEEFAFDRILTDIPATRALSLHHAVAQLQPLLNEMDETERDIKYNVVVYRVSGVLTFINAQTHFDSIKAITKSNITCLILNLRFLYHVDYDGKNVLQQMVDYMDDHLPLKTYLVGITSFLNDIIKKEPWYKLKKKQNLIWKLESDAFKDVQMRNSKLIEERRNETSRISIAAADQAEVLGQQLPMTPSASSVKVNLGATMSSSDSLSHANRNAISPSNIGRDGSQFGLTPKDANLHIKASNMSVAPPKNIQSSSYVIPSSSWAEGNSVIGSHMHRSAVSYEPPPVFEVPATTPSSNMSLHPLGDIRTLNRSKIQHATLHTSVDTGAPQSTWSFSSAGTSSTSHNTDSNLTASRYHQIHRVKNQAGVSQSGSSGNVRRLARSQLPTHSSSSAHPFPPVPSSQYVSMEEMNRIVAEMATAQGLDPLSAIAQSKALLRAAKVHKSLDSPSPPPRKKHKKSTKHVAISPGTETSPKMGKKKVKPGGFQSRSYSSIPAMDDEHLFGLSDGGKTSSHNEYDSSDDSAYSSDDSDSNSDVDESYPLTASNPVPIPPKSSNSSQELISSKTRSTNHQDTSQTQTPILEMRGQD